MRAAAIELYLHVDGSRQQEEDGIAVVTLADDHVAGVDQLELHELVDRGDLPRR